MTETATRKSNRKPGDALIGIGEVLAGLCVVFGIGVLAAGGNGVPLLIVTIPALMLVMVGYLKRITAAIEARP